MNSLFRIFALLTVVPLLMLLWLWVPALLDHGPYFWGTSSLILWIYTDAITYVAGVYVIIVAIRILFRLAFRRATAKSPEQINTGDGERLELTKATIVEVTSHERFLRIGQWLFLLMLAAKVAIDKIFAPTPPDLDMPELIAMTTINVVAFVTSLVVLFYYLCKPIRMRWLKHKEAAAFRSTPPITEETSE